MISLLWVQKLGCGVGGGWGLKKKVVYCIRYKMGYSSQIEFLGLKTQVSIEYYRTGTWCPHSRTRRVSICIDIFRFILPFRRPRYPLRRPPLLLNRTLLPPPIRNLHPRHLTHHIPHTTLQIPRLFLPLIHKPSNLFSPPSKHLCQFIIELSPLI